MEFPFEVTTVLPGRITIVESRESSSSLQIYDADINLDSNGGNCDKTWIYTFASNIPWDAKIRRKKEDLENIVDSIGLASGQAQNLQAPITTFKKITQANQQKLYIVRDVEKPKCVIGMLKVGIKRLFVCDSVGAHHEVDPLCLLDFYIHESKQRCGFGHELFDFMLKTEGITPEKLAVDRPSYKCLQFLQKHYSLNDPIQQNNNFVIYPGFLQDRPVSRPPIFLYNEKVVSKQHSNRKKISDSEHSLQSVPLCLRASDIKSKSLNYGNFSNCEGNQQDHRKQKMLLDGNASIANSYLNNNEKGCVREAMHRYSSSLNDLDGWKSFTNNSVLTPVDSAHEYSQKHWNQLQSSWNVLGVRPVDYSPNPKKS